MASSLELGRTPESGSLACLSDSFLIIDCGCCLLSEAEWRRVIAKCALHEVSQTHLADSLRHGIPANVRSEVWLYLTKAHFLQGSGSDFLYSHKLKHVSTKCDGLIERDLSRTFPYHQDFASRGGEGQTALCAILRAYAAYDPEVGYCQGMAFVAGLLYLQLRDEEAAFWMFVQIMWQKDWRSMFKYFPPRENTPKLCHLLDQLSQLIRTQLPEIADYMIEQDVGLATAFTQSLLTICSCDSPLDLALRVMDLFILKGEAVVFSLILTSLRLKRAKLFSLSSGMSQHTHNAEVYSITAHETNAVAETEKGKVRIRTQHFRTPAERNSAYQHSGLQKVLKHPAVCRIYKQYMTDGKDHGLSTESEWPGQSLYFHQGRPWQDEEIADMLYTVIQALAAAQRLGIPHGNVTPGSIFQRENTFCVTDFCWNNVPDLGCDPRFFSPERRTICYKMLLGEDQPKISFDPFKSDVYSLALVALYMKNPENSEDFGDNSLVRSLVSSLFTCRHLQALLNGMLEETEDSRCDFVNIEAMAEQTMTSCFIDCANKMIRREGRECWEYAVNLVLKTARTVVPRFEHAEIANQPMHSLRLRLIKHVNCRVCGTACTNSEWRSQNPAHADICSEQCFLRLCSVCTELNSEYFSLHCKMHRVCITHYPPPNSPVLFPLCSKCEEPSYSELSVLGVTFYGNNCDDESIFLPTQSQFVPFPKDFVSALEAAHCHFCDSPLTSDWRYVSHSAQPTFICSKECERLSQPFEDSPDSSYKLCPTCRQPLLWQLLLEVLAVPQPCDSLLYSRQGACSLCRLRDCCALLTCQHALCQECTQRSISTGDTSEFPCGLCGRGQSLNDGLLSSELASLPS